MRAPRPSGQSELPPASRQPFRQSQAKSTKPPPGTTGAKVRVWVASSMAETVNTVPRPPPTRAEPGRAVVEGPAVTTNCVPTSKPMTERTVIVVAPAPTAPPLLIVVSSPNPEPYRQEARVLRAPSVPANILAMAAGA